MCFYGSFCIGSLFILDNNQKKTNAFSHALKGQIERVNSTENFLRNTLIQENSNVLLILHLFFYRAVTYFQENTRKYQEIETFSVLHSLNLRHKSFTLKFTAPKVRETFEDRQFVCGLSLCECRLTQDTIIVGGLRIPVEREVMLQCFNC